jgi:CRISPR-associated protein Cmr5
MTANRQTLDQQRARFAWQAAELGMGSHYHKEYRALTKGASALVMGSGLMPTLAFLKGKEKSQAHAALLASLCGWLSRRLHLKGDEGEAYASVMKHLHDGESQTYMEATHEALTILKWIRQYVDAVPRANGDSK